MQKDDRSIQGHAGDSQPQANMGGSPQSRRDFMKKVLARSAFAAGAAALVSLTGDTAFAVYSDYVDHDDIAHFDIAHSDVPHWDDDDGIGWPHGDHMDTYLPIPEEYDDRAAWWDHADLPHQDEAYFDVPHGDHDDHTDHDDHDDHSDYTDYPDC